MAAVVSVSPPRSIASGSASSGVCAARHTAQSTHGHMCTDAIWKLMLLPGRCSVSTAVVNAASSESRSRWDAATSTATRSIAVCIEGVSQRDWRVWRKAAESNSAAEGKFRQCCTAAACTTAKSTASGWRCVERTAWVTAERRMGGGALRNAMARSEIFIAPPLAKEPPGNGKCGGSPVAAAGTPASVACCTCFAVGGQPR
mmetsp:Transcript_44271/g.90370  ORF Transcript_44271/g.90370 Transcript_44271/m.90370 type:complete len:201 (-) Transcript_44271:651-1253(-)